VSCGHNGSSTGFCGGGGGCGSGGCDCDGRRDGGCGICSYVDCGIVGDVGGSGVGGYGGECYGCGGVNNGGCWATYHPITSKAKTQFKNLPELTRTCKVTRT